RVVPRRSAPAARTASVRRRGDRPDRPARQGVLLDRRSRRAPARAGRGIGHRRGRSRLRLGDAAALGRNRSERLRSRGVGRGRRGSARRGGRVSDERISALRGYVHDVPDFPSPGIVSKDITPLLAEPKAFTTCLDLFAERWAGERVDAIVGIESRGFIFGAALAARMTASFVPARKPGKLPRAVVAAEYELEYGKSALEMHADALRPGERVVIIDDVIATG